MSTANDAPATAPAVPVIADIERIAMVGSAHRKKGRPVVLVPLGDGVHAGHVALVRAARRIRGAVVVAALNESAAADERELAALRQEEVDYVWAVSESALFPRGRRVEVQPAQACLEPDVPEQLTRLLAMVGALRPTDMVAGEKDYELLVALHQALADLHLGVRLQGVPVVRTPEGVAMSLRNARVAAEDRERAAAISAALTAGAHAAESGAAEVERVARQVLAAAGVEPEYVAVRGRDMGEAPAEGDGRLLVSATVGGVRLIDNAGLPLGIGFRNVEEHAAKAELERERQRANGAGSLPK